MKYLIIILTSAILFNANAKIFRDGKGTAAWREHEIRVNTAIASGVIGEVLGVEPSPETVQDTLGMGRIKEYEKLFTKTNEGIVFSSEFDLFTTILKGEFHHGHFWEAFWNVEQGHQGKYYPPGFEKDRGGCQILIHLRYSEYSERGYKLGKIRRCINGNSITVVEDERVADWRTRGANLGNYIWKNFPSYLTRGEPVLHITSEGDTQLPTCKVLDGNRSIEIPHIEGLCAEYFTGSVKIPIHLQVPL